MVSFDIYEDHKSLYQWDLNRCLRVNEDCHEVHFANRSTDVALVVSVREKDGQRVVDIPNILLQTEGPLKVYAYVCGEDKRLTTKVESFRVLERLKPADYVYTETETKTWEELDSRVRALEEAGEDGGSSETLSGGQVVIGRPVGHGLYDGVAIEGYYDAKRVAHLRIMGTDSDEPVILSGVAAPIYEYSAANKQYVDDKTSFLDEYGSASFSGTVSTDCLSIAPNDFDGVNIQAYYRDETPVMELFGHWEDESVVVTNVAAPIGESDAANKQYVDDSVAALDDWFEIANTTIEEPVNSFYVNTDKDGNSFECKKIVALVILPSGGIASSGSCNGYFGGGNGVWIAPGIAHTLGYAKLIHTYSITAHPGLCHEYVYGRGTGKHFAEAGGAAYQARFDAGGSLLQAFFVGMDNATVSFPAGTQFKVWGLRA